MGLLLVVFLGAFTGWLAAAIEEVDEGVLLRIGIGIVGSVLGSLIAALTQLTTKAMMDISWPTIVLCVFTAVLSLSIYGKLSQSNVRG